MDFVDISDFVLKLREFDGSKAEQRVLGLIDELSAADMDNISDDFMNSLVTWTTSYLLHRIAGCEEPRLRDAFIKSTAEFLSPYVVRRRAVDILVKQFHCARQHPSHPLDLFDEYHSGCQSQRAQYLARHNSTENDSTVLADAPAPCLEPPERTGRRDGMIRVSPCYSDDLVRDILAHVSQQTITFLFSHMTVRLRLANPLRIPLNRDVGFVCDSCNRVRIVVAFQSITPDNERNAMSPYTDSGGYDMCIPCALHFVHEAQQRLCAALALPPPLSRPFAVPNARLTVQSAARSGKAVRLRVALSPQSARLCVWELPPVQMPNPLDPVAPVGPVDPIAPLGTLGPLASELRALPLPPPDWRDVCRVAAAAAQSPFGNCDDCAVCLTLLLDSDEYGAVVETACGHKFHAYCIESMRNRRNLSGCPLCRAPAYLERMAKERVYDVELTLRECSAAPGAVCVAVAAMLTSVYTNPTNIVACEVIQLYPGSLLSCECQPPRTGMETLPSAEISDIESDLPMVVLAMRRFQTLLHSLPHPSP